MPVNKVNCFVQITAEKNFMSMPREMDSTMFFLQHKYTVRKIQSNGNPQKINYIGCTATCILMSDVKLHLKFR